MDLTQWLRLQDIYACPGSNPSQFISPLWVSFTISSFNSTNWLDSVVKAAKYMHALGSNPRQVTNFTDYFLLPSARLGLSKCHSWQFYHIPLWMKIVAVHLAKLLTDSFSDETKLNEGSREKWCCKTILVSMAPCYKRWAISDLARIWTQGMQRNGKTEPHALQSPTANWLLVLQTPGILHD